MAAQQQRFGAAAAAAKHPLSFKACLLALLTSPENNRGSDGSSENLRILLICVYADAELSAREPKAAIYLSPTRKHAP